MTDSPTLEEIEAIIARGFEPNFGWDDLTHKVVHGLLEICRKQGARIKALDDAPRWSRHSERCGVADALGASGDRDDLDAMVYAVVKMLESMRGHATMSLEIDEWMKKWPHGRAK